MARRKTHAEHVAEIAAKNPNVEIIGEIIRVTDKVLTRCRICGHEWNVAPYSLKAGCGCPVCGRIKTANAKRLTHTEHAEAIKKANPNIEILEEIKSVHKKVKCRCKICSHEWEAIPSHLKRGRGCQVCTGKGKWSHEMHVLAINKVNPDVEVLGKIINATTKVLCRCKICNHEWRAKPYNLKNGTGCPECKKIKIGDALRLTNSEHVAAINNVNPHIEILEEIKNNYKKVLCRCKICGHEWSAIPNNLKRGRGCPRCAKTGFLRHDVGKLYIMVDDLDVPTMMKIGVSVDEDERSKRVLKSARIAGVSIPALYVAKTWEGPTGLMIRIESMMHENYKEWNIKFPAKFDGCTEFFYYTPETAEAFGIIEETYHEIINGNKAA